MDLTNEEFIKRAKRVPAKRKSIPIIKKQIEKLKKALDEAEDFVAIYGREFEIYKSVPLTENGCACVNRWFTERAANTYRQCNNPSEWGIILKTSWNNERFYGSYYTEETAKLAAQEWVALGVIIPELKLGRKEYCSKFRIELFLASLKAPLTQNDVPKLLMAIQEKKDEEIVRKELISLGYDEKEADRLIDHALVVKGLLPSNTTITL